MQNSQENMDSRTRDETRGHNLSQPNEASNANAESKDNSNHEEMKNTGATIGTIDQKFGQETQDMSAED